MYEAFAREFLVHAEESAYNALYDRPAVLDALGSVRGLRVLDVGCGPGLYAEALLAREAAEVTGIDASATMVRLARERLGGRATFRQHDLEQPLSWLEDASFDAALMALVIHHIDDRIGALREIARVLVPGGRLVVSTGHPTADWVRQGGSYFTVEKVSELWGEGCWDVSYWRQPLEASCAEFAAAGFSIGDIREPRPLPAMRQRYPETFERLSRAPEFIVFVMVNRDGGRGEPV